MSIEAIRELETLASVCPELNMANYTEDDVFNLNEWAIEMSLLVERYTLSQQPAAAIACGIPGMVKTTCPYCEQGFAFEYEQPAKGEPFGYIHHFTAHDERGVLIDTTWEADGCADPLPHPTFPSMWKWTHCTPFYTTQQPVTGEPVAWMHWLNGPVRVFMNKDEAMMELDRLNREYPVDSGDRKMRPLILGDTAP